MTMKLSYIFVMIVVAISGQSCTTRIEKLDVEYKDDLSGSIRAHITTKEVYLDDLNKEAGACGVRLQEVFGNFPDDKRKFIAEYVFNSMKQLERSVDCSKIAQETIIFKPIRIEDNLLSRDIIFSITLSDTEYPRRMFGARTKLPPEIVITTPGEIVEAFITFVNNPAQDHYSLDHEITGHNSAKFMIKDEGLFEFDVDEKEMRQKCGISQSERKGDQRKNNLECARLLDKKKECPAPKGDSMKDSSIIEIYLECAMKKNSIMTFHKKYGKKYGGSCIKKSEKAFITCVSDEIKKAYSIVDGKPSFTVNVKARISKFSKYFD